MTNTYLGYTTIFVEGSITRTDYGETIFKLSIFASFWIMTATAMLHWTECDTSSRDKTCFRGPGQWQSWSRERCQRTSDRRESIVHRSVSEEQSKDRKLTFTETIQPRAPCLSTLLAGTRYVASAQKQVDDMAKKC